MDNDVRDQMLDLWRGMADQCRQTLAIWQHNDFRLCVNGIDITEAERAASESRIAHLEKLIAAVEAETAESASHP